MRFIPLFILIALAIPMGCSNSQVVDISPEFAKWEVTNTSSNDISWTKFEWADGVLGDKFYKRVAINIPCRIDGIPNALTFQLDLGANLTGVYENSFSGFYQDHPEMLGLIKARDNNISYYDNLTINFGDYSATNKHSYVYKNTGISQRPGPGDIIHLGTIGADIFQNKVLIIDYPNERFAICESVPSGYAASLIDITLDKYGRVILPMSVAGKAFKIQFDTGSSLFPIITSSARVSSFSTSPVIDVMRISSWGTVHDVTGRMIDGPVTLAGETFSDVKVYASMVDIGIDENRDGLTGNILFWDKAVVIDFKNKKFGVK